MRVLTTIFIWAGCLLAIVSEGQIANAGFLAESKTLPANNLVSIPLEQVETNPSMMYMTPAVFRWDNGHAAFAMGGLGNEDIEANKFVTEHPCSLKELKIYMTGPGDVMVYVWGDVSNQPDVTNELIIPQTLRLSVSGTWYTITLDALTTGIPVLEGLETFHVGVKHTSSTTNVSISNNVTDPVSHVYIYRDGLWYLVADSLGNYYPYMIRAYGEYFNEVTTPWFTDVTVTAGITGGSHVSIGDMDNDGWEDLLINGNIWRNRRDGTFEDITAIVGMISGGKTTFWDFDNDGDLDIIQLKGKGTRDKLWRNDFSTSLSFVDLSHGIGDDITDTFPSASPGIGDFDNDRDLDIYIANSEVWMIDHGVYFPDFYYVNNGTFFLDDAEIVGMGIINDPPYTYSRIAVACDFDDDNDLDLYIGNYRLLPNWLFSNNGDGTFVELADVYGVQGTPIHDGAHIYYGHTIGAQWVDVNNDLVWDLFIANLAHPRFLAFSDKSQLFIGNGPPLYDFTDKREEWGIQYYETHSSCVFGDFNNDGLIDLFISCVYDGYHSFLYENKGDHFENVNYQSGIYLNNSWGCAWTDYDHDGDLDLIARHQDATGNRMRVFRNETGNHKNWVQFVLQGKDCNKFAVGSVVKVYSSDLGFPQMRQVDAVVGTEGTSQGYMLHFGLDMATTIDSVVVKWMGSGHVDKFTGVTINKRYKITEGGTIEDINEMDREIPKQMSISAYPNPFNTKVNLMLQCPNMPGELKIYSTDGRIVRSILIPKGNNEITIDASDMPTGTYLVIMRAGEMTVSKTIILMK